MPILKTEFEGRWVRIQYESPKSHNIYEIHGHWETAAKQWVALSCTCKSFAHRATCRHLDEMTKSLAGIPEPPSDIGVVLKRDYWIRCGICAGVEFMIRPRAKETDHLELICAKCGRLYKEGV